jgi:hypothetical protein
MLLLWSQLPLISKTTPGEKISLCVSNHDRQLAWVGQVKLPQSSQLHLGGAKKSVFVYHAGLEPALFRS